MLDAVRHDDGGHMFIVKGGTAMQLRVGIRARATADLDVTFRGGMDTWLQRFDAATANHAWQGFTVERKAPPTEIDVPGLGYRPWRVALQIRYEGRDFGSTSLEVAIDEPTGAHHDLVEPHGIVLAKFGIDPPNVVPCLNAPYRRTRGLATTRCSYASTRPRPQNCGRPLTTSWISDRIDQASPASQ
jgi:hypothetical protein